MQINNYKKYLQTKFLKCILNCFQLKIYVIQIITCDLIYNKQLLKLKNV